MVHPRAGTVQPPIDKGDALPHIPPVRLISLLLLFALNGCVVGTVAGAAVDVVTLPVKVASAGVDAVTTSQSEADEKRGREMRKAEARCRKGKPRPDDDCSRISPR